MPRIRLTTGLGPWSSLPSRLRLGFITVVIGAASVGILAGTGWLSLAASVLLLSGLTILSAWCSTGAGVVATEPGLRTIRLPGVLPRMSLARSSWPPRLPACCCRRAAAVGGHGR